MIQPALEAFRRLTGEGNLIPVYREVLADLDTPLSAFLKVAGESPHAFLLESVEGGEKWGRYSILGADPEMIFTARGRRVEISKPGEAPEIREDVNPVTALRELMGRYKSVSLPDLPRFHGGAVGYMGYDAVRWFEEIPDDNPDALGAPDALYMFMDVIIIFDNLLKKLKIVANVFLEEGDDPEILYNEALAKIDGVMAKLAAPTPPVPTPRAAAPVSEADFREEMSPALYEAAVAKAKEYILAGDIMQVVLAQRLAIDFPYPPLNLYRALRSTNPSPYLFFLRLDGLDIVGSSPEILVRQEGETITVRPIAGTRPRGADTAEDKALEEDLLADPKERAEHLMLLDLGRNDLGRVAETGSVKVTDQYFIERYSHVMHIVSNVEGKLKEGLDAFDLLAASFPAGTVSGAPKIRAMEIIDELEVSRRGPYAGAVGYVSYSGHADWAIAIRTAVIQDETLYIQAGAGIVADSVPINEHQECRNKARAVFRAVDLAQRGLE